MLPGQAVCQITDSGEIECTRCVLRIISFTATPRPSLSHYADLQGYIPKHYVSFFFLFSPPPITMNTTRTGSTLAVRPKTSGLEFSVPPRKKKRHQNKLLPNKLVRFSYKRLRSAVMFRLTLLAELLKGKRVPRKRGYVNTGFLPRPLSVLPRGTAARIA